MSSSRTLAEHGLDADLERSLAIGRGAGRRSRRRLDAALMIHEHGVDLADGPGPHRALGPRGPRSGPHRACGSSPTRPGAPTPSRTRPARSSARPTSTATRPACGTLLTEQVRVGDLLAARASTAVRAVVHSAMREHDLELLELPAVLARLAGATASEPGAALAAALRPSADEDEVARASSRRREAISLLDEAAEPDLGGAADVTEAADLAARGQHARHAHPGAGRRHDPRRRRRPPRDRGARGRCRRSPSSCAGIDPSLLSVAEEIGRAVEEDGSDLKDSASPALRRLRRELREGRGQAGRAPAQDRARPRARRAPPGRLRHRARRAPRAGAEGVGPRPGARHRPRLLGLGPDALRRAARGGRGLEPAARGRGRRARRGGADPAQPLLARRRPAPTRSSRSSPPTAELDLALACGEPLPRLARAHRGCRATRSSCVGARHPLLDRDSAVPIDLELGTLRALVISGPNTGGKTVALKTLGLAAVLHQCGLRPPARRGRAARLRRRSSSTSATSSRSR